MPDVAGAMKRAHGRESNPPDAENRRPCRNVRLAIGRHPSSNARKAAAVFQRVFLLTSFSRSIRVCGWTGRDSIPASRGSRPL